MDDLRAEKAEIENRLQESMQREKEQTAMIESLENRNKALRSTLDKTVHWVSLMPPTSPMLISNFKAIACRF